MSEPILSLAAKFTLPSKAKAEGTFTLTSTQLIWEPDELGAADSVLVAIKDVSGTIRHMNGLCAACSTLARVLLLTESRKLNAVLQGDESV